MRRNVAVVALLLSGPVEIGPATPPVRTVSVATAAQLRDALAAALPGDHIVVARGEYEGAFDIRASGTPERPIVVRSAAPRQAAFVGQTQLDVRAAWIVIEGFRFSQAHGVRLVDSANV